jgi:glucosamine kinase
MAFFLALDVGGTKTDYLLADETRELARVRSGSIKRMRVDAATATTSLDTALAELARVSGVDLHSITRTCIGTAGETVPLVTDWLREAFADRVGGDLILVGDVEIALDAAFHGGPGVLVLAGTGSNVAARAGDGTLTTAGGWGPALADQGSGHRIGLQALRSAFLALDEGRPTQLLNDILACWKLSSVEDLVEYANRTPAPDFSTLTEVVLQCADAGDALARVVLQKEGEDLAYLVRLVLRRIQPTTDVPALAFAGSILHKVLPVREALIAAVGSEFPSIQTLEGVIDHIAGAVWRARSGR